MNQTLTFSDDELTAWLDGETEHAPVREIEEALTHDVALQARVNALTLDIDAMKGAFDSLLTQAPPPPALSVEIPSPEKTSYFSGWRSAAAAVALVVAGGLGYMAGDKQDTSWRGYVAAYQALYINETLATLDRPDEIKANELARISNAIAKPIDLPALQAVKRLDYKRAQVLGFEGRPLIQLAFLTDTGDPVALCIIRTEDAKSMSTIMGDMEGLTSAKWADKNFEYLLIGSRDKALIKEAAEKFSSTI